MTITTHSRRPERLKSEDREFIKALRKQGSDERGVHLLRERHSIEKIDTDDHPYKPGKRAHARPVTMFDTKSSYKTV